MRGRLTIEFGQRGFLAARAILYQGLQTYRVGQLEGQQRTAIALSFFDDLSHGEIARRLQAPLGTIKSWVRRGMERLKRCLS